MLKDRIFTIIAIIFVAIVAFFIIKEANNNDELVKISKELDAQMSELRLEEKELQDKFNKLEENYRKNVTEKMNLLYVFLNTDESFFDEIVPKLVKESISGTLCLTKEELLGDEAERFTDYEANYLINNGWETALYWDGEEDFNTWFEELKDINDLPDILCLKGKDYDISNKSKIFLKGFKHIILILEENDTVVALDDEINLINAYPWYTYTAANYITTPLTDGTQIAMLFDIQGDEFTYEESQFDAMLSTALKRRNEKKIAITTPISSYSQKQQVMKEYNESTDEINQKIHKIQEKIDNHNDKIDEIHAKYK